MAFVRFLLAIPIGLAPRRYWRTLDVHVPVTSAALLSAIATFFVASAIGIPSFLEHAQASAGTAVDTMLQATGWKPMPAAGATVAKSQIIWVAGSMSLLTWAFTTSAGVASVYLGITGWIRIVAWYVDDAWGDPLLTIADGVARRVWSRNRRQRATIAREKREGAEVPDVLMTATDAGVADADLVVIASRRKPEWDAGAIVVTDEKWFKLGASIEQQMPGGWRTLYPLTELHENEVLRRAVRYTLPQLRARRPRP
jgi:hypothetical protein